MDIFNSLINKQTAISVTGLGYVGLPLALEFGKKMKVIGFDLDKARIESLASHIDTSGEWPPQSFEAADITFTSEESRLKEATFHIVTVQTPLGDSQVPDLSHLLEATRIIGRYLKKGDYVVYESTVYPGATEEECIPLLEETSGLRFMKDFKVGYSPERINPGDKQHTLLTVVKVVAGCDEESLENIARIYGEIVEAGIHRTSSIKVAEAAKIIENTQRDVNIALMNELSIIFNRMGINTYEVLDAAGTKWNFMKFSPGLVGGHCIGVDPYYLSYKARKYRYHPQIINSGRFVNDSMGYYVAKQTVKRMIENDINVLNSKVLLMGITFKENVNDIRNTRAADIVTELISYGVKVDVTDPRASDHDLQNEYGLSLVKHPKGIYNAVIVAVAHNEYRTLNEDYFLALMPENGVLIDVKGIYRGRVRRLKYWSL